MILLLLALLLPAGPLELGERAYGEGRWGEAYDHFRAALAGREEPGGALLYNLGNCAYRLDRPAEALLWYRRARRRLPRDREVRFNLELAEQSLGMSAPARESFGAAALALADGLGPWGLPLVAAAVQALALAGLVGLGRRRRGRLPLLLLLLLGLSLGARLAWRRWLPPPPEGIVLARTLPILAEPRGEGSALFTLRGGTPFRVVEATDRWVRLVHERGAGWAPREKVGLVE